MENTTGQLFSWVGTAVYMSPERVKCKNYTYNSDIWSLGLTLLELAIGKFPYNKGVPLTLWDATKAIVESPPPIPSDLGTQFQQFVSSMLQMVLFPLILTESS